MRIAIVLNEQGEPAEFAADGEIKLLIIRRPAAAREHAPVIPASARGLAAAVAAPVTVAYQAVHGRLQGGRRSARPGAQH